MKSGNKSKVAIIRCEGYEEAEVKRAVVKGIELLGDVERIAQPSEKILLKPNLLLGKHPEKCVTTHPNVFRAVAELFLELGAEVYYGDSPGIASPKAASRKSQLEKVAIDLGIQLADFETGRTISFSDGHQNRQFIIARGVFHVDGLVSLPKLKTHGLTRITGAVKNQFGCIPGLIKSEFHVKLSNAFSMSRMLVDLTRFLRPRLYIMDGIMAMEGNGPSGGTSTPLNVLLLSTDPVALDATVCRIINLNPEFVPTNKFGLEQGLGTYLQEEIEVIGDALETFVNPKFDVVREPMQVPPQNRFYTLIKNRVVPRPEIDGTLCTRCGSCVKICPATPKAVNWIASDQSRPPAFNYNRCIRCYCCQETCPEKAISLRTPLLGRVVHLWRKSDH